MGANISQLERDIGTDQFPPNEHYFGLVNFGNTCYSNSVLQALYFCKPFRDKVLEYKARNKRTRETLLSCLADLFHSIATQKKKVGSIAPKKFITRLRKEKEEFDNYMQQDAHEFLNFLINHINECILSERPKTKSGEGEGAPEPTWVHEIFQGILTSETRCLNCETVSSKDEDFFDLQVDIDQNTSITHCLRCFSNMETLSNDNKFKCDHCTSYQEATVSSKDEDFFDLQVDIDQNTSITHCLRCFSNMETLSNDNKFKCDHCTSYQEATTKIFRCQKQESRYVCPRCNIPYCSLPCYQSDTHAQCSESFYKDCVQEQIAQDKLDPQSQKNMMEILQRVQQVDSQFEDDKSEEIDSDDESDAEELAKRLAGVDLDDADLVWEQLTEEERRQFEELLKSRDVSQVVPPWEPWWNKREKCKLIEDLDTKITNETPQDEKLTCPKVQDNIQPFSKFCKATPSPCVRWNVVNILAAYALTARVYNGDFRSSAQEAAKTLVTLSDNLSSNQLFNSPETAVVAVHLAANNGNGLVEGSDESQLKDDVQKLVAGPSDTEQSLYVLAALTDVFCLFTYAKNATKGVSSQNQGEFSKKFVSSDQTVYKSDLNKYLKKLDFYLSWTKECF